MAADRPLNVGEWSVLALLCEQPAHGWALAAELAPDGPVGVVWSLTRPLVYRALELLEQGGLAEEAGEVSSVRGPARTLHRPTPAGRTALAGWLAQPVPHLRDVRPDLLLKLLFSDRSGLDPTPLLTAQRALAARAAEVLEGELAGTPAGRARMLLHYRVETAHGVLRFVEAVLAESPTVLPGRVANSGESELTTGT
jgi:DNA-binding PadR family transcriptional regulator